MDYAILASELLAGHPDTGAYDADSAIASQQINEPNREVERLTTPIEASDATDADEFNALPDVDQQKWISVLAWGSINLNAGMGLATSQGIWAGAAGTITRPALIATRTHLVGRSAELLLGMVRAGDIEYARAL